MNRRIESPGDVEMNLRVFDAMLDTLAERVSNPQSGDHLFSLACRAREWYYRNIRPTLQDLSEPSAPDDMPVDVHAGYGNPNVVPLPIVNDESGPQAFNIDATPANANHPPPPLSLRHVRSGNVGATLAPEDFIAAVKKYPNAAEFIIDENGELRPAGGDHD